MVLSNRSFFLLVLNLLDLKLQMSYVGSSFDSRLNNGNLSMISLDILVLASLMMNDGFLPIDSLTFSSDCSNLLLLLARYLRADLFLSFFFTTFYYKYSAEQQNQDGLLLLPLSDCFSSAFPNFSGFFKTSQVTFRRCESSIGD